MKESTQYMLYVIGLILRKIGSHIRILDWREEREACSLNKRVLSGKM